MSSLLFPAYPIVLKSQYSTEGQNVLMIGPPGSGKTMLAKRIPTVLPKMNLDESIETTRIHSVVGALPSTEPLIARRPFRAPH